MKQCVLITGATAGFGEAMAWKFAREGHDLIITGRRSERLDSLANNITSKHKVQCIPLCFDVRDPEAVRSALAPYQQIDILINNAGLAAGLDLFQDASMDDWERMIDTNVKGLLYVSKAVIPAMIENGRGHIINIGSTAGKEVYQRGNVYCATKHAVDAITKGMRADLLGTGIKVTKIAPGAAETEFSEVRFHGDKVRAKAAYNGYQPMTAEDIAEVCYYCTTLPEHLCINDLVMTSLAQANSFYIHRD